MPSDGVKTDKGIEEYLRSASFTGRHSPGTCKMGVDEMAVVDPKLRVRGVEQLRVVDASVKPVITSGNSNAPTIMRGERAADFIRSSR